jgi:hypothetical protein
MLYDVVDGLQQVGDGRARTGGIRSSGKKAWIPGKMQSNVALRYLQ